MNDTRWGRDETRQIAQLIKDIDICMFVTRENGSVRGRPMSNNGKVEYDGDCWFFSYRDSGKVAQIQSDPSVELAYVATEQGTWVSIEGTAEVVEDDERKRELWEDELKDWFKEGADDDDVVLIKVQADRVHAWANGEETIATPGRGVVKVEDDR